MRVCDLIAKFVKETAKVDDVFLVSGGGLMFLTDGLYCNDSINKVCCHHEQAAAMSAVGYAKYRGMGCVYLTTGCGGTNAVTALLHAWQDSTPCFFISGQVKRAQTINYTKIPLRQYGVQEANITEIVKSISKYTVVLDKVEDVLYHLEKALYLAKTGRPGPVWFDVPMDIQSAKLDDVELRHFDPAELEGEVKTAITDDELKYIEDALNSAKKPLIIAGNGVRCAQAIDLFYDFVHQYQIPVSTSRVGFDVLPTEDPLYIGRIGNKGTRAGNIVVQNADVILVLGSRLSVSSIGHEQKLFAKDAKIIIVDVDKYEHTKPTINIDRVINADIKDVLQKIKLEKNDHGKWAEFCANLKVKYPVCLKEYYNDKNGLNLYLFMEELSKYLKKDSVVVADAGSAVFVTAQGLKTTTREQRYIPSGAQAEMGFTLPGAIGVATAKKGDAIGITGDGSLQMNIQEFQTLVHYNAPVKLFVWNNDGYLSIRGTQNVLFGGHHIGTDSTNGVSFPDLKKVAEAYGLKYFKIQKIEDFAKYMPKIMGYKGPVVIEVMCIRDQDIIPSVGSIKHEDGTFESLPIDNMRPFLTKEELEENIFKG